MTDTGTDGGSIGSPAALLERDDIIVDDRTDPVEHDHHFELYEPVQGIVAVGVTDGDGRVLLRVHESEPYAVLPYTTVAPGESWIDRGMGAVAESTGVAARFDGVRRVKRRRYTPSDDDRTTTGYQLFLDAVPAEADPTPAADAGADWRVGWYDAVPVPTTDANEETLADIRVFLH